MMSLACAGCGGPFDVEYLLSRNTGLQTLDPTGLGLRSPIHMPESIISLGEGNTPIINLDSVGEILGLERVYAKLEFMNPTGSFKDRGAAVMISMARELGLKELVEDSSGNAGASVSAYSAKSNIEAHIFAPTSAPQAKIRQIRTYGASVHSIEGPREATTEAATAYANERGLVYASHNLSPYFLEGTKTIAYEIVKQCGKDLPAHMVFPVGNGSLFIGAWKGFRELVKAGTISGIPRLHCIQARAVMPIVAAYSGYEWYPDSNAKTVAGGIASTSAPRKQQILDVLLDTDGVAKAVDETDILKWQNLLSTEEGVFAEPTSAAAFAGLESLVNTRVISPGEPVLVPVTGFGLKDDKLLLSSH